ncbi:DUF3226 domain-containing protein [Roseivirga pacifica]|uniref:DUF3226 domain-containing protein n=1 Tax=Roseivirga pacifica TaxID=1267423 RepID=UPI003BADBC3B
MSRVKLVVEGASDVKFLQDFIKVRFEGVDLKKGDFIEAHSNNLKRIKGRIETANKRGECVLLVFDADQSNDLTKARLIDESGSLNIVLDDVFLFPDNSAEGNLENLLLNIVNPEMTGVLDCIDSYEMCVRELVSDDYKAIDNKGRVFIYADSFLFGGGAKPGSTDFTESRLWDLNSEHLNPLYEFLRPYFIE